MVRWNMEHPQLVSLLKKPPLNNQVINSENTLQQINPIINPRKTSFTNPHKMPLIKTKHDLNTIKRYDKGFRT